MKIGDLFIALGFKIEGDSKLADIHAGVKKLAGAATVAAAAVNGVNAAILAMIATAAKAAVGFQHFTLQTGLSAQELQRWQHMATVNGISAESLTKTIEGLQDARAQFALGEPQAVGAWAMLGVNPLQDPFAVLQALRNRLKDVKDVGIARNLASRVGISDEVFAMLRASNPEFEKWNKNLALSAAQEQQLVKLNAAWKDVVFSVTALKNRIASELVPVFLRITEVLRWTSEKLSIFVDWLHKDTAAAGVVRVVIGLLVIGMLGLGAALAALAAGLGIASVAMTVFEAVASPVILIIGAIIAAIVLLAAMIAYNVGVMVAMLDDFWTAFNGGRSFFKWDKEIATVNAMVDALNELLSILDKVSSSNDKVGNLFNGLPGWAKMVINPFAPTDMATNAPKGGSTQTSVKQENNTTIHVDGSQDPRATGRAVGDSMKNVLSNASRQMPVLSY